MKNYTDELRRFWSMPTFERARDESVTVPPNPAWYTDDYQDLVLLDALGDVKLVSGQTILDYGCGIGRMTRALLRRGMKVIAVDVSPEMLEYCRQFCDGLSVLTTLVSDGYGCPEIPDASIDGAISFYCFQHMPTLDMAESVLRDIRRVLVPGGWFVLQSTDHGIDQNDGDVGFLGERQTPHTILESVKCTGFSVLPMHCEVDRVGQFMIVLSRRWCRTQIL